MYDPTVGRFITEDPIGFDGGDANTYRYVGNSPTNATDPSGLAGIENPGALRNGQIALFFGHHVPPVKDARDLGHAITALVLQDRDHISAALDKMRSRTKAVPDFAYIAAIGCFPEELKAKVDTLFPGKWLPKANAATAGVTGTTDAAQDLPIAYAYFKAAIKQAKDWLNDPKTHLNSVTITIYIGADFMAAVKKVYPKNDMFRMACERGTTVLNRININTVWKDW